MTWSHPRHIFVYIYKYTKFLASLILVRKQVAMASSLLVHGIKVLFLVLWCLMVTTLIYTISIDGLPFRWEILTPYSLSISPSLYFFFKLGYDYLECWMVSFWCTDDDLLGGWLQRWLISTLMLYLSRYVLTVLQFEISYQVFNLNFVRYPLVKLN